MRLTLLFLGLVGLCVDCTFYTACPTGNPAPANPGAGGAAGGGAGTGGAAAGSAGITGMPLTGSWVNVTSNLANQPSDCANSSFLSGKPDEDLLIAGIAQQGLWGSRDGGGSWSRLGQGTSSEKIYNRANVIVYDPQSSQRYWECGTYNQWGAYATSDDGDTYTHMGDLTHVDTISVDFSGSDRNTILAAGHEAIQKVYLSTNGGAAFTDLGANVPPGEKFCSAVHVIDASTFLLGCSGWTDGNSVILRSTDAGQSWTQVAAFGGSGPVLHASDGSLYWALEKDTGLARSDDLGLTWQQLTSFTITIPPVELPDGRIAASNGHYLVISADHGVTWQYASPQLPFVPLGIVYSSFQKAFFVWHADCNSTVPADAYARFDFDYQTQ